MDIEIFTICDYANDVNGKLTIVGTFDTINSAKLPAVHLTLSIVVRIRFSKGEANPRSFSLSIVDANDKEIIPPFTQQKLQAVTDSIEQERVSNIVVGVGLIKFNSFGKHSVKLSIDDKEVKALRLTVNKLS